MHKYIGNSCRVYLRAIIRKSDIYSRYQMLEYLSYLSIAAVFCIAIAGGILLSKHISSSLKKMCQTAEAIGQNMNMSERMEYQGRFYELAVLTQANNRMLDRLEETFRQQEQFTSDVAHELRTPIAVMMAQCQYAHGKAVKPNNVSVGERNIIALCYFFTELIMNQEAKDGYSKKLILVIDDPISSFDFENKVGIMSLLKAKVADIIKTNPESQILVMTHDIQCLYDLQKIGEEVCNEYKRESNGQKKVTYACCELKNKEIIPFSYTKRNEYSEILKAVYDYACGKNANDTLIVGNLMRRVMEAFSTFVYKKGIAEISCDDTILQQIGDKDYIDYFKNLMYRLVLNGDSHMLERTNSLDDMDYLCFLSNEERRRTAQEVICFIYLLNKRHVLAHLEGKQNIEINIQKWCADIKSFCAGDEVTV